jgi:hypothetical protein
VTCAAPTPMPPRNTSPWPCPACAADSAQSCVYTTAGGVHRDPGTGRYIDNVPGEPMLRMHHERPRVRCLGYGDQATPSRCPACAALAGNCACTPMPDDWRALGFTGLFWIKARADDATRLAWEAKGLPRLLPGDGWALARFDSENNATLVRRDDLAVVEAFTRQPSPETPDPTLF